MYSTAQINQLILNDIYTFLAQVSTTYGIPVETLKKILHGEDVKTDNVKPPQQNVTVSVQEKKEMPTGKCIYRYIRGAKAGVLCGTQIKNKNNFYCSKHKACETNENIPLDQVKQKEVPKDKKKVKEVEPPKSEVILRLNAKIGKYVHPLSGLVFFSKEKREVCGKLNGDKMIDLVEEDFDTCKKFGFKILETSEEIQESS